MILLALYIYLYLLYFEQQIHNKWKKWSLGHNFDKPVLLMYSSYGTNVYGLRGGEFEENGVGVVVESCKLFLWWHFLFTCSDTFAIECRPIV